MTFAVMDLKLRYRNSILGVGWSFLEPLLLLSILNIVFSTILKNNIEHFPIFLILGLTMFHMFTRGTSLSIESILGRAPIIKSVYLKREIFPIAATITALLMMTIEFSIVAAFVAIFQFTPTYTVFIIPVLCGILFVFTLGISMPLSILNARFRDVRIIWTVITQALFFLTPIFYKITFLPAPISTVVQLNPVAQLIEMAHNALLYDKLPTINQFGYTAGISFAVLVIGWLIFRKMNRVIDEVI
ncbi:MAG: ABC transporter permease [Nitrosopumilaceae archaeon]